MKIGDIVSWNGKICVITEVYKSKCWRTAALGKKVNWGGIEPEPFARILWHGHTQGVPQTDLEVISESR